MAGDYIAIDWGTTNRRAWRVARDGTFGACVRDSRGVLALTADDYPAELGFGCGCCLGALPWGRNG